MLGRIVIALAAVLGAHWFRKLYWLRYIQFKDFPQVKGHLLLGHLKAIADRSTGPKDQHGEYVFDAIGKELGSPSLFLVDLRPFNAPLCIINDNAIADQLARPSKLFPASAPKFYLKVLVDLLGRASLVITSGEEGKAIRKRFAPAFAPGHLMTLIPGMLTKVERLAQQVEDAAHKGEEVEFAQLGRELATDIIGIVALGLDFNVQSRKAEAMHEIARLFFDLIECYKDDKGDLPAWAAPRLGRKRKQLGQQLTKLIKETIREKHEMLKEGKIQDEDTRRSIVLLSVPPEEELTEEILDTASDQLKTFLFAGSDTTATTLSWVMYYLERCPRAGRKVHEELDHLLGPNADPSAVSARLSSRDGPEILNKMTYMMAVIKETLRLQPPASTARFIPSGTGLTVQAPEGQTYCLDGLMVWNQNGHIQRDPRIWGPTADVFVPERWLEDNEETDTLNAHWRAFEKGPRNCLGQDFALIEIRLLFAVIFRRYKFSKVGLGELGKDQEGKVVVDEHGIGIVQGSELYSVSHPVYDQLSHEGNKEQKQKRDRDRDVTDTLVV